MTYHIAYIVPNVVEDFIEADGMDGIESWLEAHEIENSDIIYIEDEDGKDVWE